MRFALLLSLCSILGAQTTVTLRPVPARDVKVQGEIGRRIDITIHNNLLALDASKDFLASFESHQKTTSYLGLGKLLLAAIRFADYTQDPRLIAFKSDLIRRTIATQQPDGYIGFFPPAARITELWDVHELGYIIAALNEDYARFDQQPSLQSARKAADYLIANWSKIPPDWGDKTGVATHVAVTGVERTFLALYQSTKDPRYLHFVTATRDLARWQLPIIIGRRPGIEGHIYAFTARTLAQLELAPPVTTQSTREIDFLAKQEGMAVTGGAGQWEIWTADQDGRGHLAETCATAYLLRLYEALLRQSDNPFYGDLIDRTVFNTLFAAQSPGGRRIRYYTPFEGPREYHPGDTYCCPGNYRRIIAELPEMIYYTGPRTIAVNLYTASTAKLPLASTTIGLTQQTAYPSDGRITLQINPAQPAAFALKLRIPAWAQGATVQINSEPSRPALPATFHTIDRTWKPGDQVTLNLPMNIRLVRGRQQQSGRIAVLRGPQVYTLNPAQSPQLKNLDAADLTRFTLDPQSLTLVPDNTVRPNGTAIRAGAWKPGYSTAAKHDLTLLLTEFTDPAAQATYFKLRDLSIAVSDELTQR
ncbi:MAG: glycoside hydrolase family 127 protein [Acidobacteria bacterium]|nr:glycoside hydrolase family 127 protein [Acidobacteriota bacterium]